MSSEPRIGSAMLVGRSDPKAYPEAYRAQEVGEKGAWADLRCLVR